MSNGGPGGASNGQQVAKHARRGHRRPGARAPDDQRGRLRVPLRHEREDVVGPGQARVGVALRERPEGDLGPDDDVFSSSSSFLAAAAAAGVSVVVAGVDGDDADVPQHLPPSPGPLDLLADAAVVGLQAAQEGLDVDPGPVGEVGRDQRADGDVGELEELLLLSSSSSSSSSRAAARGEAARERPREDHRLARDVDAREVVPRVRLGVAQVPGPADDGGERRDALLSVSTSAAPVLIALLNDFYFGDRYARVVPGCIWRDENAVLPCEFTDDQARFNASDALA